MESLAKAGAFDSIEPDRHTVFASAEIVLRRAQSRAQEKEVGQVGLFGGADDSLREVLHLKKVRPWPDFERLSHEAAVIGFHMSAHPLDAYCHVLRRIGTTPAFRLEQVAHQGETRVRIAGCVVDKKERPTKTGKKMAWVTLTDASGGCEVTLFSETLASCRELLVAGQAVLVYAELKLDGDAVRITANTVLDLEKAAAEEKGELRIWIDSEVALEPLQSMLETVKGGRGRVVLMPSVEETQDVAIRLPEPYRITPRLAEQMGTLEGVCRLEQV